MSEPTKDEVPEAFRQAYRDTIDLCDDPGCDMDCERIMAEDMANYWREDGDGPGYFFRRGQAACGHQSSPEARAGEEIVLHRYAYNEAEKMQPAWWGCVRREACDVDEHASFLRSSPGSGGKE